MTSEIPFSSHENNNGWDQDYSRLIPSDESAPILFEFQGCMPIWDDLSEDEDDYSDFEDDSNDAQEDMGFDDNISSESYTSPDLDANDHSMQLQAELALGEVSSLPPPYTFTLYSAGSFPDVSALRLSENLSANEGPKMQPACKESIENLERLKIDQESSNLVCSVCLETISIGLKLNACHACISTMGSA